MTRVSFFIDGFNLYHSLKDFARDCRWLNLRSLCESYLKPDEQLGDIYYFTAVATWNTDKSAKHKLYIKRLALEGVQTVYGKFKKVSRHCNACNQSYETHEEKRTDVNVALRLFSDAVQDKFDTAILISADSDLIPPIQAISTLFPDKRVGVVIPLGRQAKELKQVADFNFKIERNRLKQCLFPKEYDVGGIKITAPEKWLPKKD